MDYDDNDFQSQNLHLAGEGNNKFPPVLRPYALPRFDFDDNLHGHLRFDSLVETEVFLGIESSETNQWIEDFSRGSTGIAFSSSAAEPCSISRHNNVWSEAASSESVEMLLKSVGQDETIPGQTIRNDSDVGDELGCIIKQMEPSLKHEDSGLSKVGDDLVPALQTGEIPGEFSGLKADAGGNPLVEDVSQKYECEPSVHGAFEDPNAAGRNNDLPVTERDESNDCEQIVNENQMDALVDRSVENSGEEDKFASGSQVDTVITHVQSTPTGSSLKDSQDTTHLKNDIIDENVDSLEREKNVDLSQEVHIDGKNLIDKSVASFSLNAERHSALDTQPKDDGHAIGNSTANVGEDFDGIVKGDSDLHMVEGCSEGLSVEVPLQTGKSEEIVLSEGKLLDISKLPSVGDTTLKEHESKIGNADTCTSSASNMDSTVQVSCDAIEKKGLVESDCQPDMNFSSGAEESLLSVEDGKGSKAEGAAEPMRTSEDYMVTEHNDVYKCDQSVSAAEKQNAKLPSVCGKTECGPDGSPLVTKGVDPSSISTDRKANELASNLPSDVAASCKSVDCVILPSGKATSGMTTGKGTPCETREQFSCEKVDLSSSVKDTSNAEAQSGDQKLENDRVEDGNDMQAPSLASASTVRETGDAEAQVISVSGSSEAAVGDVSVQQNDKIPTNPAPSTTKEPSSNTGQDHEPKSASQMKISDHVDGDPGKITNSSFSSTHSSESQTKLPMMESGKSSADVDNPSCGSPIVIRTSEQSQTKIGKVVKRSTDQSASASGIISEEANKEQSISQDAKGNDASPGDRSFTFEVPPLANFSEKEASKNWQPFSTMQHDKISPVVEGTPSTSRSGKVAAKTAQDASQGKLQTSEKENVRGGSKGTSERKTRRASGRSTGRESAKKGIATKETTPTRQSDRNDRTTNAPLSSPGIGQLVQSNEMQPYGHVDGGNMKSFGVLSTSVSNLPDLNTSASSSAAFNQPFTDLQQVQLRAQIFVYGALIQGTAPDEACMISAFGGPDGGRTIWENAWRVCMERLHGQKSHLVTPETSLQPRIGAKASDQSIKQSAHQSKATSTPASRSTSKGTPTTIVNPMIPLSSPLWSMSTPSGDALQPTSIPRAAVLDYQQTISPLHPPPIRNFVGHNASWMSQSPFRAPWVPQTSTFDANARFPVLPITETVTLTPVRESSLPHSSGTKQVSSVPIVQTGSSANIFAGTPLLDTKKSTLTAGQQSADPKPRKRKKSTATENPVQIMPQSQTEPLSATIMTSHAAAPIAIADPATIVSKSTDKFITSVSADHLNKGERDSDQSATLSEETLGKLKEAQKQAEDAASLASTAVSHRQEIWNQLEKHKNSGLAPDVVTKLTSAAVAIAAAAAVAKAAAAAADVASNAALQAKQMADEALVSSGYRDSVPSNTISSSNSVKKLGKATPASILRGEDVATSSNSVILAAREAARRRVEAASAASKQAENMDAIVRAAELAAEAVSQAGKIVAMGEPFSLNELVEAGPESYWKVPQASPQPDGVTREHMDNVASVEAPGSSARNLKEVQLDKREKEGANHAMSPTLKEMARESMEDRSRLTDGNLRPAATGGKDKKGQKGRKSSDISKTKGVTSESLGFESPSMITQTEHEKAGDTSKDNNLREGSRVEVLRDGGGLKVAWFTAEILNLKDGKAYVCYNELRSEEDGDRLKEWVDLEGEGDRAPRIRIARPITAMPFEGTRKRRRAAMGDYNWSVGDRVDAWMQDSWWEGVVTEKSKKDETSFTVHFPAQGETSVIKAWLLRPSLMWKNGSWVEWSTSGDNNSSSHEGDTPREKRVRVGSPAVEAKGKDKVSKSVDIKESGKPDDMRLLDLSASERIFNIGKSTRDESRPDSLRTMRTGLQKEGSRVIFGVPKPGKKRKFMEVSKHYVADQSSKSHETSDPAKFTKYLMPQGSGPRGTKGKIEPKEKRMAVSKPKVLKSGKPPSVSSRTIPQKDNLSNSLVSEPDDDALASDVSKFKDSTSHSENISGKQSMMEFRSFSSSDRIAEGPFLFSSVGLSTDAPPKKASTSNARSERNNKGKLAPAAGRLTKVEEEKVFNGNSSKTTPDVAEPRRSNRRIQPTSRLLEGLQSSLIISKIPSVSHDKGNKSQSKSSKGNNHS